MLKNIFLFSIFVSFTQLNAMGLKELLNSIESNDSYQSKLSYVEKSKKEYESASTHIYPNIDMVGNYENNTKVYTDEAKSNVNGELKASYTLYDGEKLKNNELSKKSLYESEELKIKYTKQEMMLNVIKEYFAYQNAKSDLEVLNYKIKELDEQINKSQILVTNELSTKDKLQALIASKKEAIFDTEDLKIQLKKSSLQISLLTGKDEILNDNQTLLEPTNNEFVRDDIEAKRLEAKSLKHNASSINYLPTVTINNSLKQTDYINYHGSSYEDGVNNQVSLQVSMPIFDAGKISKDKEASQLEVLALNKEIEYDEKRAKIEKDLAFLSLESAKAKLNSAVAGLEATKTAYDYSKKRFESNLISYTEYLEELTKKQEANSRVITAKNEIEIKKAELAFALGTNLITLIKE